MKLVSAAMLTLLRSIRFNVSECVWSASWDSAAKEHVRKRNQETATETLLGSETISIQTHRNTLAKMLNWDSILQGRWKSRGWETLCLQGYSLLFALIVLPNSHLSG